MQSADDATIAHEMRECEVSEDLGQLRLLVQKVAMQGNNAAAVKGWAMYKRFEGTAAQADGLAGAYTIQQDINVGFLYDYMFHHPSQTARDHKRDPHAASQSSSKRLTAPFPKCCAI